MITILNHFNTNKGKMWEGESHFINTLGQAGSLLARVTEGGGVALIIKVYPVTPSPGSLNHVPMVRQVSITLGKVRARYSMP